VDALTRIDSRTARRALLWHLVLLYAALEGALWTAGLPQRVFIVLTATLAIAWTLSDRQLLPELGLDPRSIGRGWWIGPIGAALGGLVLLASWHWQTLRWPANPASVYAGVLLYIVWALIQQFLVQSFFFLRLEQLLHSGRRAAIAAALLFASAHILSGLFRRYRTLYLLAVAQAFLALSISVSVPETVLHDMRVGIGYFCYPADCRSTR
jgi:hypothetical protein